MDKELAQYLEAHEIAYEVYEHPAIFTVAEGKRLKVNVPGLHCKCLFLKDEQDRYYLLGMEADKRCDMKALRKELGVRKLHFGSDEALATMLRVRPGSVSIFALIHAPQDVMLLLDEAVWKAERVGFHPNINTATIVITHKNLERYAASLDKKYRIVSV